MKIKIVADENIPGLQELFGSYGEIFALPGRSISPSDVADADILLVRSVTAVNQALLQDSPVHFIGSCTIGTDHLDIAWLEQRNIKWAHAPGCNAQAVVDYVLACLLCIEIDLPTALIGIVGCGHVGGLLNRILKHLQIKTLCCDPFLQSDAKQKYLALEELLPQVDVLCLHTPLTKDGMYPTFHLINNKNLSVLKSDAVLLNAGRGAVVDTIALTSHLERHPDCNAVLDVWENEPAISTALLNRVKIATPHIAGYSQAGKWRGTEMIFRSFCQHLSIQALQANSVPAVMLAPKYAGEDLKQYVLGIYDPMVDSNALKNTASLGTQERIIAFDDLRKKYKPRKELIFF